jgi:cytochrome c-type biogenesis protein CcmH/NrfF
MSAPPSQQPDPHAEQLAQDLAREMPSPYCPGRTISSCPSEAARELEDDILALAQQGKDRTEIEQILIDRFGADTMGEARNDTVFFTIVGIGVVALILLALLMRRWLAPDVPVSGDRAAEGMATAGESPLAGVAAAELDRLEDELDELDEI